MAADRIRFFPSFDRIPVPASGNGKAAPPTAPAPSMVKGVTVDPRVFASGALQFWPTDGNGGTTLDFWPYGGSISWLAYVCTRYRAIKLIEAPLWFTEEQDGEESWLDGDRVPANLASLAELLEQPNPDQEMAELLELTSLYLDTDDGGALWLKLRDSGDRVRELHVFRGDDFSVHRANGRQFGRFEVNTSEGKKVFGPDDVIWFRNANSDNPKRSFSPLTAAMERLGIDRELAQAIRGGLRNAVVPGMILTWPETLGEEQRDEIEANLGTQYAGAKNQGKSLNVGGGVVATRNKLGFEGLHSGELGKEIEAAVCSCFQLPPVVIGAYVGLVNSSDRHNLETSVELVYDNAIVPTWTRIENALTRGLLRPVDKNRMRFIRFDRSGVKALQRDLTGPSEVIERAGHVIRVNEGRAMLGLSALGDGDERGDEMADGSSGVPVDETAPGEEDAVAEDGDEEGEQDEGKRRAARRRGRKSRRGKAVGRIDEDQARWAVLDALATGQEMGWSVTTAGLLNEDRIECVRLAGETLREGKAAVGPAATKDVPPFLPADTDSVRDLLRKITDYLSGPSLVAWRARTAPLIDAGARGAVERAGVSLGVSFDLLQPGVLDYVQREAAWLVKGINATTRDAIRDALGAGLAEGEGIPQLTKRIQEATAFSRERAELIARTESTRVTNGGQRESLSHYAAASGSRITKRWLSARDARVRDEHRKLNGQTRGIDEAFSNGLQQPGEPNCRCTLTYALESAA